MSRTAISYGIFWFVLGKMKTGIGSKRWIRDSKIPELYKDDLREAFENLGRLSDADWKEIDAGGRKGLGSSAC